MAEDVTSNASTSRPGSPVGSLPGGFSVNNSRQPAFRFTWDPTQKRRVGPGSVSGYSEAESRADFINTGPSARQEILNLSTANLSLAALGSEWSSAKHGFHAISTVLNHPTKRAAPPKAHSSLTPVAPADLPRAKRKDFDPYLKDIALEWDKFDKNLKNKERRSLDDEVNEATSTVPDEEPLSPIAPSESAESTRTTRPNRSLPSLDIVPEIFFAPEFNLGDPNTFSVVTEQSILLERNSTDHPIDLDPASISYSLPLLEKLSHYADTVEQHLVREIQARSTSFFSALTNLHDLQSESSRCIRRISELKEMLNEVNEKQSKRGLEVVRGNAKLTHLDKLRYGVEFVKEVNDMKGIARQLQEGGEWSAALNAVENVNTLWEYKLQPVIQDTRTEKQLPTVHEESPRPSAASSTDLPPALQYVSLPSIRAFAALPEELRFLMTQIASTLTSEFASVAQQDLILRNDNELEENPDEDQAFRERLTPLMVGLAKTGSSGVKEGMDKWREVVMGEVRRAVKKHLDIYVTEIDEGTGEVPAGDVPLRERSATLAQSLNAMNNDDFLKILRQIFRSLLWGIKGASGQSQTVMDIIRAPSDMKEVLSRIDSSSLRTTFSDILFAATELAHNRVSKVIGIRAEQNSKLKLREFHAFFEESMTFVVDSEVLCQKMVVGLRGVLGGQSKAFLQAFHAERLTKSAKMVEDEQWVSIEVSPRSQRLVDVIVESAVQDAPEIVFPKSAANSDVNNSSVDAGLDPTETAEADNSTLPEATSNGAPPQAATNGSTKGNAKYVTVEDRAFYVVSATVQVLGLTIDYLKLMVNLSALTMESMSRLIEFLKAFNSRTCQVVLGAGAMRSAGLKNITARNLALASQSLSVMVTLIPYIRETYRRHLNPKQAVMLIEFDKLKRDYQEHQNEIHTKLISIMGERLTAHCKSLNEVQWDEEGGEVPNAYIKQLVKETVTLHKVLSKYLGPVASEPIMSEVFASINHRLGEEYQKIPLPSPEAKDRMLADARYLHETLSGLRGVGSLSNMVETIVQEKTVMRKSVLNPNGIANGSTPRPRGSIDLQPQGKLGRQSMAGGSPLSNPVVAASNIAARPSPFAKRGLANLFGGSNNNANVSTNSLPSNTSTREGSPAPQVVGGSLTVESSEAGTPEVEGRVTPAQIPSPPGTPSVSEIIPKVSTREESTQNGSPRGSLGVGPPEPPNGL